MGTDKSQEPPTSARLGQPRALKFRTSCDACSSSKIKCDQVRPSCRRCSNLGTECNYSLSRRTGKPPGASRDPQKAKRSGSSTTRKKPAFEVQGRELGHTPAEAPLSDQSLPAFEMNPPEPEEFIVPWEADVSNLLNWNSNTGNAALTAIDASDQNHDLMSHSTSQQFGSADRGLVFDDNCMRSVSSSFHNKGHNGPQGSADALFLPTSKPEPSNPPCYCTSLASSTLHNLVADCRVWDAVSSTRKANPSLTIDRILINNKAAIENAYRILACPCSLNPGFSLTITLICYHIIERYEAIVRAASAVHGIFCPTSSAANLLSARITVGEYQIDVEDEQTMRIQLVVNELRKMRGLVDKYGERYCTGLYGGKERHEGIHSALEMFLMSKLKDSVNYMVHTLQS